MVEAENSLAANQQVKHYLKGYQLITYADLVIRPEEIISGKDTRFWPTIDEGVVKNLQFAGSMLTTLKKEGVATLDDLLQMEEGYLTKVLHTLTHLLDGFIGVDSVFYNLVEDSHRVRVGLKEIIEENREQYWLIPVRTGMLETSVLHV